MKTYRKEDIILLAKFPVISTNIDKSMTSTEDRRIKNNRCPFIYNPVVDSSDINEPFKYKRQNIIYFLLKMILPLDNR